MVQNISSQPNGNVADPRVLSHLHNQGAEKITPADLMNDTDAAQKAASPMSLEDNASVSPEARARYEKDREVLKFVRLAQRTDTAPAASNDKVVQLKNMVDTGKINDYLRSIDTNVLVNDILASPAGAFLK